MNADTVTKFVLGGDDDMGGEKWIEITGEYEGGEYTIKAYLDDEDDWVLSRVECPDGMARMDDAAMDAAAAILRRNGFPWGNPEAV